MIYDLAKVVELALALFGEQVCVPIRGPGQLAVPLSQKGRILELLSSEPTFTARSAEVIVYRSLISIRCITR